MPTDYPHNAATPPNLTLFEATESQLVDELRRRNTAVVVVCERAAPGVRGQETDTEFCLYYRGGLTYVLGLLTRARVRLAQSLRDGHNNV